MKKTHFLFLPFFVLYSLTTSAQLSMAKEFIDVNSIKASYLVHGDMWSNLDTRIAECEYPKGTNKHVASFSGLYMSGYVDSQLCVAAQNYRLMGNDYWPGPIMNMLADSLTRRWGRIWKINRQTIDSFRKISNHTTANTPEVILNWPAVGNGKAKDAASGNLTYLDNIVSHPNKTMAPFVDVDNDGKYDPLKGDYPQIKGDQMLWWIINDGMTTNKHTESGGNPLFVEIQNCIYAYNRPNAILDDVVFHEYTIYNWGLDTIKNYRFGLFAEMNIGYANNDYVGYDSAKRFAFAYNSFNSDMEYTSGIPAAGIMFTELPGDNYPQSLEPSGSFTTFRNVVNVSDGTPLIDTEYNYILRGKKRTGEPNLHGRYQYPGTIMCDSAYSKFEDRRFVLASNDITLTPSTKQTTFRIADSKPIKIGVALLVIPYVGGCPNMNLSQINAYADTILSTYYNPPAPTAIANNDLSNTWLRVYPNPANGFLQIDVPNYSKSTITITDITGRVLETLMINDKININTSNYPSGCYIVLLKNDSGSFVAKFMKE